MARSSNSRTTPSYDGLEPASKQASAAARGSSKKRDTRCEVKLRKALWHAGVRYRKNVRSLPGKPDIVFYRARLAIFCDGDFWHGKDWGERRSNLSKGANPDYWVAKIERNRERDREHAAKLDADGWTVLRFWESEIHEDTEAIVEEILSTLKALDKRRRTA